MAKAIPPQVLVFGKTGQVGRELARHAGVTCLGRAEADLNDPAACAAVIAETRADVIINAAAYTAVDSAESEEALAMRINGDAVAAMAAAAAARNRPFLQISTDYVFDGAGESQRGPETPREPLNAYGRSKAAGEAAVVAAGGPHMILRTSWVFSARGQNFVKTMLALGAERDALSIVSDQIGGPTPARDIAAALMAIAAAFHARCGVSGIYHYAGAPDVSWAEFAAEIFARAGQEVAITPILTAEYPTPARRPLNSRLDCTALQRDYGIGRPDWRTGLEDVLRELGVCG